MGQRQILILHLVLIDPIAASRADDADHSDPRRVRRVAAELDLISNPVAVGPQIARGLLVDDQFARRRSAVDEVTPLEKRNLHRAQIAWRYDAVPLVEG